MAVVPGLVQAQKHNATQLVLEMQNIKFSSNGPSYGDYAAKTNHLAAIASAVTNQPFIL